MQLTNLDPLLKQGVVIIGVFDGFHRGHRLLLEQAMIHAQDKPLIIVSFNPHPKLFFGQQHSLLASDQQRIAYLSNLPVAAVLTLNFDQRLAATSAADFVEQVLVKALEVSHLVVGENFRFGANRSGDLTTLQNLAAQHNFQLTACPLLHLEGEVCSSTRIRNLLAQGGVEAAARLLGRPWQVSGLVNYGKQANPDVPTVNVALGDYIAPKPGVYAGFLTTAHSGQRLPAAIYYGQGAQPRTLEAHILDKSCFLYDQQVTIHFQRRMRADKTFKNQASLHLQIAKDLAAVRKVVNNYPLQLRF